MIAFIVGLPANAQSDYLQQGISAFKEKNYASAITAWEQGAAHGDAVAMYNLGRIYSDSNLNKVDLKRSVYWYDQAAAAGNIGAQYNIGRLMLEPKSPIYNVDRAIGYWSTAADNGHVPAMRGLANLYMVENAPWQDQNQSLKYLTMAARAGDADSQKIVDQLKERLGVKPKAPSNKQSAPKESVAVASPRPKPATKKRQNPQANNVKRPIVKAPAVEQDDFDLALSFIDRADGDGPIVQINDSQNLEPLFLKAQSLYRRGQKSEAIELMRTLAHRGFTKAYTELAQYELSIEGNLSADTIYFLSLAAEMDDNRAQLLLGDYLIKKPTKVEQNRGWYWLAKAYAKNGATEGSQLSHFSLLSVSNENQQ